MKEHTISGNTFAVKTVNIDYIKDSGNIRANDSDVSDLAASIKAHGMLHPITVTQDKASLGLYYVLVAGHRRFAAAKQIGLKEIPCHVISDQSKAALQEIALTENVSRVEMTPYEECLAVKNLENKKNTPAQIAKRLGRTLRWVLVRKKIGDAGEKVLNKVKDGLIELVVVAKIADLPDNVFKKELESCYRTDKHFIDGVLDRYHKDLSRAPFEHEACLQCAKCSACQADLFEDEPKAYCLDPNCWTRKAKKAAEAKVKKLQEEGRNARLGKFSPCGVSYDDEANNYEIGKYNAKAIEQAKEAGIQKRVLVDATNGKTFEYFDKRDLPNYHEETDEERQERLKNEDENREFENVKTDLFQENLSNAICEKIEEDKEKGKLESLLFIMHFVRTDWLDDDEELQKKMGIEKESGYTVNPEDFPQGYSVIDFTKTVIENLFDIICNWPLEELKGIYRIVMDETDNDPGKLEPTDDDVKNEMAERQANAQKDDSDSDENEDEEDED